MKSGLIISSLLYFVFLMLIQNQGCNGCLEKERIGLLEIKLYIFSLSFFRDIDNELGSWVDDRDSNCCSWNRVTCSNFSSGHITELSLDWLLHTFSDNIAEPSIQSSDPKMLNVSLFRPFEELRLLDLSYNSIQGWTGNEGFPRLKKLETLDLSWNYNLNSSILSSLNGLTALTTLNLRGNDIHDFYNQGFPRLKKLETLDLSMNYLNSSLSSLNGLTALRTLNLSDNEMDNNFCAQDVQHLRSVKMLSLRNNQMNGSIEGLCILKDLVELDISNNSFGAKLPECLSNLTNLRVLELSHNLFSGNFPSFTSNLTSLTYLSIYGNYMQGSFSLSTLANHSNLENIYISSQSIRAHVETERTKWFPKFQLKSLILRNCNLNTDKGSVVPSFLSYQYNLILMDLSGNKIVGSFPSLFIHNGIQYLDISDNNLSGLLPKDIDVFLPSVTYLNFSWNNFEGNIPSSIGKMKKLECLDFSYNHFSGELPKQLATDCDKLQYLKLSNNFLQGNIPKFCNSVNMFGLFLNNNNFTGTLEDVLGSNIGLVMLSISNNSISGTIPSSIGVFSNMQLLLMGENLLEGEIPIEISNMSSLQIMDLSQNKLVGSIPDFSSFASLKYLYLQKNGLSGSIPSELSGSSPLELLDLRDNNFSSKIPNWMDNLSELRVLLLGGNNLEGDIPSQLCRLRKIDIMDLSRNMLNGSITYCFQNLSFGMGQYDDLGLFSYPLMTFLPNVKSLTNASLNIGLPLFYQLDENLHLEVEFRTKYHYYFYKGKVLEIMTGLDLSCNKLTGTIPSHIGDLQQIIALNLSHNHLSGPIPITVSNLTQIESLDLSYNNLSGKIPYELTKLNFLSTFNLSYNNLSGTPPSTGQFADFDEDNYRGNPGLCGPLLNRKCELVSSTPSSQYNDNEEKETNVDMITFYWSFTASYITILLAFITVLCINPRWRMAWFYYISKFMRRFFPNFPLY